MTKRAKWAFNEKEQAERFVKENGGRLASFDEVMKASFQDMYSDKGGKSLKRLPPS